MKFKLFIFLALLFAIFLLSSAAVVTDQKSKEETKVDATEQKNEGDDQDAKYVCRHRCCGHYGCRCCSYAEAQLMENQPNNDQKLEGAEAVNPVDDAEYYGCRYRCCGHYGCRCCTFAEVIQEELNQLNDGGYGGGRGGGYGGGRGGGGYGGGGGGYGGGGGKGGGGYGGGGGKGGGGYGGGGGKGGGRGGGRGGGGGGYGGSETNP